MPQIVTCPDCGRKLRVPDDLIGKKVKCPGCGQKFVGEADEEQSDDLDPPASRDTGITSRSGDSSARRRDEDDDDAPKSRRGRDEEEDEDYPTSKRRRKRDDEDGGSPEPTKADIRQGWERVRFGINLIIMAVWIGVGAIVAVASGVLVLGLFGAMSFASIASSFGTGGPPTQQNATNAAGQAAGTGAAMLVGGCVVGGLIALLALAQVVSRITGLGFCMGIASTRKTQALKGLAIAAFSLAIANVVLPMLSSGASFALARNGGGCIGFAGEGLYGLLALAEVVCFLLFLRGVAAVMKKEELAKNIVFYMIALPIYFVTLFVLPFIFVCGGAATIMGAGAAAGANTPPGQGGVPAATGAAGNMAGAGAAVLIGGITCAGVEVLIGLALFIWYVVLLYQVRYAVDRWIDRN